MTPNEIYLAAVLTIALFIVLIAFVNHDVRLIRLEAENVALKSLINELAKRVLHDHECIKNQHRTVTELRYLTQTDAYKRWKQHLDLNAAFGKTGLPE